MQKSQATRMSSTLTSIFGMAMQTLFYHENETIRNTTKSGQICLCGRVFSCMTASQLQPRPEKLMEIFSTRLPIVVQQSIEFVPNHWSQSIGTCPDRLFEFS